MTWSKKSGKLFNVDTNNNYGDATRQSICPAEAENAWTMHNGKQ